MRRFSPVAVASITCWFSLLAASGCGLTSAPDAIDSYTVDVDRIRNDTTLSAQQRRVQLRELGLTDTTINGLLRSERTGNQYGGDLRSAYDKVHGDTYNTMTPDEVQLFGDAARSANGPSFQFTDAQAQAIADLFRNQDLRSATDVTTYVNNPDVEIPDAIPDGALTQLFVDFDETEILDQLP